MTRTAPPPRSTPAQAGELFDAALRAHADGADVVALDRSAAELPQTRRSSTLGAGRAGTAPISPAAGDGSSGSTPRPPPCS